MSDLSDFKSRFQRLLELRETRDIDDKAAKKSEKAYREYEAELFEEIREAGIKGRHTFDFGGDLGSASFQLRTTVFGRVVDKDVALKSLEAEGVDGIIYERAVRKGRLNELVRDRQESHNELPDGIDFYPKNAIAISRK